MAEVATGQPLTFTATVEVRPEIELRNYKDFSLPEPSRSRRPPTRSTTRDRRRCACAHAEWSARRRPAGDRRPGEDRAQPIRRPSSAATAAEVAPSQTVDIEVGSPQIWEEISLAVTGLASARARASPQRDAAPAASPAKPADLGAAAGAAPSRCGERTFEVRLVELSRADPAGARRRLRHAPRQVRERRRARGPTSRAGSSACQARRRPAPARDARCSTS